jgi:GNAT superfamily N-acetyltransferase
MELRALTAADVGMLDEIDATIESVEYLHVEKQSEGLRFSCVIEPRPTRSKLIESFALTDEMRFEIRQLIDAPEAGMAAVTMRAGVPVGLIAGQWDAGRGVMRLLDLRVDYDHRREGLATAMLFRLITDARERGARAIAVPAFAFNGPLNRMLVKFGFELTGLDTFLESNHDIVKERVTLWWYLAM